MFWIDRPALAAGRGLGRRRGADLATSELGDATPHGLQRLLDRAVWSADEVRDVLADPLRRRNRQRARQQLVNGLIQTADVEYHRSAWGLEELSSDAPGTSDPVE